MVLASNDLRPAPLLPLEIAWRAGLEEPASAWPAFDHEFAFIPLRTGHLTAIGLADGAPRWTVDLATALPPAADGRLVLLATGTELRALDRATGTPAWRKELGAAVTAPLLVNTGWLITALDGGAIVALRASDGHELWRQEVGGPVRVRPSIAGDHLFVSVDDGRVVAFHLHTGDRIWERRLKGRPQEILPLDDLFVGATDNLFYRLAGHNGLSKWSWRTGGDIVGMPAVDSERVYFLSMDNILRALDRRSGVRQWQRPLESRPAAGPLYLDDLLVVASVAQQLKFFRASDGVPLGEIDAPAELAAPPHLIASSSDDAFGTTGSTLMVLLTGNGTLVGYRRGNGPPLVAFDFGLGEPLVDQPNLLSVADALAALLVPGAGAGTGGAPVLEAAVPLPGEYTAQLAAMSERAAASAIAQQLTDRGLAAYVLEPEAGGPRLFRVRAGRFADRQAAQDLVDRLLLQEGLQAFVVLVP
jgi:outer membrane protein assembly factor BamB